VRSGEGFEHVVSGGNCFATLMCSEKHRFRIHMFFSMTVLLFLRDVSRCCERGCRDVQFKNLEGFFDFLCSSFLSGLVSLVRGRGFGFRSVDVDREETSCKKWSSGRSEILLDLVLVLE
jgi:hypothetical protein